MIVEHNTQSSPPQPASEGEGVDEEAIVLSLAEGVPMRDDEGAWVAFEALPLVRNKWGTGALTTNRNTAATASHRVRCACTWI